jgi:cytochrome c oxidase assembly protein Cox11
MCCREWQIGARIAFWLRSRWVGPIANVPDGPRRKMLILRGSERRVTLLTKRDEGGAPFFDELAQGLESDAISRRKAIKLGGSALVASAMAGLFPSQAEAQRRAVKALKLYWSSNREDNFTTGTKQGKNDAIAAGYQFIRNEGYCFRSQKQGTKPLRLYWNPNRGDNFTTGTKQGRIDAENAGYQFIRIEGYCFRSQKQGTVPLKLYWNPNREDNFTTSTQQGEADAKAAGYQFIRIEGYVYSSRP